MAVINFPDPAGQTPLNTYSPTSQPYGTSNGITYVWDSGAWTIKGSAGGGTDGDGRYLSLADDAGDQTVQSTGKTTFTGQVVLPGGGSDTEALQKQEVEALINASDTADGNYLKLAAGAGDQTVASTGTTTFTGQVVLPGGGSDTEALQKQEVEALINASDTADGNYLKLAADAGDQTVASTGTTRFEGLIEAREGINANQLSTFAWGLRVTGGAPATVDYGIIKTGGGSLGIRANSNYTFVTNTTGQIGIGGATPNAQQQVRLNSGFSNGDAVGYYNAGIIQDNTTSAVYVRNYLQENVSQATTLSSVKLFDADHPNAADVDSNLTVTNMYGFYSNVRELSRFTNSYNFHASGSAPNFFAGSTYIGGTTTRNTRELWESTLTEEQKEQLSAGTLTVPANVSTPGDGSFARQWWYDQQSAEDQALINAGELDYPSHFQAANFVDTFALGDNTNINLLSNGTATFAGSIFAGDEVTSLRQTVNFKGGNSGPVFKVFKGEQDDFGAAPEIALNSDGSAIFNADVRARYGAFGTDIDNRSVVKIGGAPVGGALGAAVNSAMLRIEPTFSQPDSGGIAAAVQAIITNPPGDFAAGTENYRCITATGGAGANNTPENGFGFFADQSLVNTGTVKNYGFYSNLVRRRR